MLFFIDESGPDQRIAPYEVLAAVAVEEKVLWDLITAIHAAEVRHFGLRLKEIDKELKGRKLLKSKIFRHAALASPLLEGERLVLCRDFLMKGFRESRGQVREPRSRREFAAYGQAVLAFIAEVYDICSGFQVKLFASMVPKGAPRPEEGDFLRKDYAFLFERVFHFLEDRSGDEQGLIVFDEIEKAKARILIGQMERYFIRTRKGRERGRRIIPQPFFVHSDLTTAVQLADVMAYSLNWGFRLPSMREPTRPEMEPYGRMAAVLRYVGSRYDEMDMQEWRVYGIVYIPDLRARDERDGQE